VIESTITNDEKTAIEELRAMSRKKLEQVPHDIKKWVCQCKRCTCGTKVWDFGMAPLYYWPVKKGQWVKIPNNYLVCGKHNRWFTRLEKSFEFVAIRDKLLDWDKIQITDIKIINNTKRKEHATSSERSASTFI
jgi:hypothetical protein